MLPRIAASRQNVRLVVMNFIEKNGELESTALAERYLAVPFESNICCA